MALTLSGTHKLLLILVITSCIFSETADAWSWSWGSGQPGSNWGWGWSSNNSGSGSSGSSSGSNSGGSSWGWGWSSNGTDTNWGWGSSSGSNHSSGTGSTHNNIHHNNHTAPSNHSTHNNNNNNHTAPSNHSTHNNNNNHTVLVSPRRKIEVTVWKSGFDYAEWATKHAPFYTNDVVVFKYTQSKTKHNNNNKDNVYLLPDSMSYKRSDISRGKKLATRGRSSRGFKLLLRRTQTYYFVNGDRNGCNHNMKFSLSSIPRKNSHARP
ncbi:unnamed protein product [Cochlearia groenlandica]